jgi:hypothetical protein
MDLIEHSDPYVRTVLEFIWAFTDWWESAEADELTEVDGERFANMEQAYERWRNQR